MCDIFRNVVLSLSSKLKIERPQVTVFRSLLRVRTLPDELFHSLDHSPWLFIGSLLLFLLAESLEWTDGSSLPFPVARSLSDSSTLRSMLRCDLEVRIWVWGTTVFRIALDKRRQLRHLPLQLPTLGPLRTLQPYGSRQCEELMDSICLCLFVGIAP